MRFFISRRKLFATIQVVILALIGSGIVKSAGLLVPFDNHCLSLFYYVRDARGFWGKPPAPHKEILVVALDDASFKGLDRRALTYADYLQLLCAVRKGGARAVGLDVLLSESDGGQDAQLAPELDNVVLPYLLPRRTADAGEKAGAERLRPTPVLEQSAAGLGFTNTRYKRAGCRIQLLSETSAKVSFPLAVLAIYAGKKTQDVIARDFLIQVGDFQLPVERDGTFWVNYFPPDFLAPRPDKRPYQISAAKVLSGEISPEIFKDKLVLIGRTDRDAPRYVQTPVDESGRRFSEVQIYANVLSTMLNGYVDRQFIGPQSRLISAVLLTGLITITCLFALALRPVYSVVVFAAEVLASFYGSCILFTCWKAVVDLPLLLIGITQAFGMMMIYVAYQREDEVATLSAYIAPAVRKRIVDSSRRIPREGERKELTILYADLRGFTAVSHRLEDARATVLLLNEYFDVIVPIIAEEKGTEDRPAGGGTVDKLMGDGILAFFGDPVPFPDAPQRAASAALTMRDAFDQLHSQWHAAARLPPLQTGEKPFGLGIAIATGQVIVGNIGSRSRGIVNYTVVGDAVNLASHLQRIAGQGQILLDKRTAELLEPAGFKLRPIGERILAGVTVNVFELLGRLDSEPAQLSRRQSPPLAPGSALNGNRR